MGSPVRPIPTTPDDAAFQAWKAQQSTPDDSAFQAWRARQRVPSAGVSDATDTSHPMPAPAGNAGDVAINAATLGLHPVLYGAGEALKQLITGHGTAAAGQAFTKGRQEVQKSIADAEATKPQQSGFATALGMVTPFAAEDAAGALGSRMGLKAASEVAPEAATLGGRVLQSAGRGAITGGAYNAINSDGTPKNRVLETLMGVLEGGAAGGATPLATEGAARVGSMVNRALTPIAQQASGAADRQIAHAIQSDGGVESVLANARKDWGLTPADESPMLATSAGPEVNNAVNRATSIPGQSGYTLAQKIEAAKAGEGGMIKSAMQDAAGTSPTSAYQATNKIDRQQSISAHNLYGALEGKSVDDPEIIQTIRGNPDLSAALGSAVNIAKRNGFAVDNPLLSGTPGDVPPAEAMAKAMLSQGIEPGKVADFIKNNPGDVATWTAANQGSNSIPLSVINHMKQGADDVIGQRLATDKTFTRESGKQLQADVQSVIQKVDAKYPEFARARAVFANDAARKDAIAAGESAVSKSLPAEQVADEVAGLKSPNADAPFSRPITTQNVPDYKTGAVSAYGAKIDALSPESNVSQLFNSKEDLSRVHAILGDEGMQTFNDALNSGKRVEATASRVASNPASQQDAVRQAYGPGSQPAVSASPRYSMVRLFRNMAAKRQDAFQTALGDALAKRLAIDPTGQEGAQFFQKVSGILDKQSATQVAARAQMAALRMKATAGFAGILAAKGGKPQ